MFYRHFTDYHGGFRAAMLYTAIIPCYWAAFASLSWLAYPYLADAAAADRMASSVVIGAYLCGFWIAFIDGPTARFMRRCALMAGALVLSVIIPCLIIAAFVISGAVVIGYATGEIARFSDVFWFLFSRTGEQALMLAVIPFILIIISGKPILVAIACFADMARKIRNM